MTVTSKKVDAEGGSKKSLASAIATASSAPSSATGGLGAIRSFLPEGVSWLQMGIQVASAILAVYLTADAFRGLSGAFQIAAFVGVAALGSYLGYMVWDLMGETIEDFLQKVIPFDLNLNSTPSI